VGGDRFDSMKEQGNNIDQNDKHNGFIDAHFQFDSPKNGEANKLELPKSQTNYQD
jgi:hypothetical protein